MAGSPGHRARGSLQAQVMAALWQHPGPVAVAEVRDAVDDRLSYNAVHTILTRLCQKGLVERRRAGRSHLYWAINDPATTAAAQMHAALTGHADRRAVLQHFAALLDPQDADALRDVLPQSGGFGKPAPHKKR